MPTIDTRVDPLNLIVPRYSEQPFTLPITLSGSPVDLSTKTLIFALKSVKGDPDLSALLIKDNAEREGITIADDPTTGLAVLTFDGTEFTDTTRFVEGQAYPYGVKLYPDNREVVHGNITIYSDTIQSVETF